MKIETGQIWTTVDRKEFRVIDVVDIGSNTWVHYINKETNQEYSCYKESFESRFTQILNQH
jgi:hypothetical protein